MWVCCCIVTTRKGTSQAVQERGRMRTGEEERRKTELRDEIVFCEITDRY